MDYPIANLRPQDFYRLAVGSVLPRPIAWISTRGADGVANLAPFSFFTVASIDPPVLCFTHVNRRDSIDKDTLINLQQGGECVVHTVSQRLADVMNQTSGEYPANIDEFAIAGLTAIDSRTVAAPSLRDAPVRFECRLREVLTFSPRPMGGRLVLLDVLHVAVADEILDANGQIDPARLDAIGKLGGDSYSGTRERFILARPKMER